MMANSPRTNSAHRVLKVVAVPVDLAAPEVKDAPKVLDLVMKTVPAAKVAHRAPPARTDFPLPKGAPVMALPFGGIGTMRHTTRCLRDASEHSG